MVYTDRYGAGVLDKGKMARGVGGDYFKYFDYARVAINRGTAIFRGNTVII